VRTGGVNGAIPSTQGWQMRHGNNCRRLQVDGGDGPQAQRANKGIHTTRPLASPPTGPVDPRRACSSSQVARSTTTSRLQLHKDHDFENGNQLIDPSRPPRNHRTRAVAVTPGFVLLYPHRHLPHASAFSPQASVLFRHALMTRPGAPSQHSSTART